MPLQVLFGDFAEAQSRNFKEAINGEEFAEDYGYLSDSDLEDEKDKSSTPQKAEDMIQSGAGPSSLAVGSNENQRVCEDHEECIAQGKVVKIPDVAFVT